MNSVLNKTIPFLDMLHKAPLRRTGKRSNTSPKNTRLSRTPAADTTHLFYRKVSSSIASKQRTSLFCAKSAAVAAALIKSIAENRRGIFHRIISSMGKVDAPVVLQRVVSYLMSGLGDKARASKNGKYALVVAIQWFRRKKSMARRALSPSERLLERNIELLMAWYAKRGGMGELKHRGLGSGETYFLPRVKDPNAFYSFAQDKIPIPSPSRTLRIMKGVDWNSDNFMQGNYERYQLWKSVGGLSTVIQSLRREAANDPAAQRIVTNYQTRLKKLIPLYRQLPLVDVDRQVVRIYGRDIKIMSGKTTVSQEVLLAIGESIMSAPIHFIYDIVWPRNDKQLTFVVKSSKRGATAQYDTARRAIVIRAQVLNKRSYFRTVSFLKHELGHAVDHYMGRALLRGKTCQVHIKALQPIAGKSIFVAAKMPCLKLFSRGFGSYRTSWPDHARVYAQSLKTIGYTKRDIKRLFKIYTDSNRLKRSRKLQLQMKTVVSRIGKSFVSFYAATNVRERFAEAWRAYWTLSSPWTRWQRIKNKYTTRTHVRTRSPFYYKLFESLWNRP